MSFSFRFFTSQTLSMLGNWVQQLALLYYVYQLHPSSLYLAIYMPLSQIPLIVGLPMAGKWADRIGRVNAWKINVYLGLVISAIGAVLIATDTMTWTTALLFNLAMGVVATIDISSRQGFIIDASDSMHKAIALDQSALNMARVIGPLIGGIIQAKAGMVWCFIFNVLTYALVILILWPAIAKWQAGRREKPLQKDLPKKNIVLLKAAGEFMPL